eukprot:681001-Rhodomonas_salina.5
MQEELSELVAAPRTRQRTHVTISPPQHANRHPATHVFRRHPYAPPEMLHTCSATRHSPSYTHPPPHANTTPPPHAE